MTIDLESLEIVGSRPGWANLLTNPGAYSNGTVVEEERQEGIPADFALSQNYPNPFNSQTVIRFDLPAPAVVDLSVFDLAGQKVDSLVDGHRQAGAHALR